MQHNGVLLARHQRGGTANLDAFQATRALPGIDVDGEQSAAAGPGLFHGVEEGPCARYRIDREHFNQLVEMAQQRDVVGFQMACGVSHQFVEGACILALAISFAHRFGQSKDMAAHGLGLRWRDVELLDAAEQQFVNLMHHVGNGGVRANQRALHAAGAQIGPELGNGAAEQPLVFGAGTASGHEQPRAGQYRCLANAAVAEWLQNHVFVVLRIEHAGATRRACALTLVCRKRGTVDLDRRRFRVHQDKGLRFVINLLRGFDAFADHGHIAIGHGAALATEFLVNLLAHFFQNRFFAGAGRNLRHVPGDGADEGDAHHACGQFRRRRVLLGNGKGIDDQEADLLRANGLARLGRQLLPDLFSAGIRLQDEGAACHQPEQWIGVAENFVIRCNHNLNVFQLGVGNLDRLRAQRDVVVGRCPALFGTVLRRRFGMHAQHAGQNVGQQFARSNRAVATDRVEAHTEARIGQQLRVGQRLQGHRFGLGVSSLEALQQFGHARCRAVREELRTQINQRHQFAVFHILEGRNQVARLQVVPTQAEDGGGQQRAVFQRRNTGMTNLFDILTRLEQRLRHQTGQHGLVRALQHRDRFLAFERGYQVSFRERLQLLDRHQAHFFALAAQVAHHGFDVIRDRAQADHHGLGVIAHEGLHRLVLAPGQCGIFVHRLAHEGRHSTRKMGAVVNRTGLKIGLVLHRAGETRVVHIDQRRHQLARALLESVEPLALPWCVQLVGQPAKCFGHQFAGVVGLDLGGILVEKGLQLVHLVLRQISLTARQVLLQLNNTTLGTVEHLLRQRRRLDATGRVAQKLGQQFGLGHQRFTEHVAGGKTVHGVGHRDQRERRDSVRNRGQISGLLRVGAEQNGVARRHQRIDIVMPGHHVERMFGDHARSNLQHKAADLLAHGDVMRFECIQDALTRRSVGDELAAGQRRTERTALRRVLAFGSEEERVLAPDIDATFSPEGFVDFGDLG